MFATQISSISFATKQFPFNSPFDTSICSIHNIEMFGTMKFFCCFVKYRGSRTN